MPINPPYKHACQLKATSALPQESSSNQTAAECVQLADSVKALDLNEPPSDSNSGDFDQAPARKDLMEEKQINEEKGDF